MKNWLLIGGVIIVIVLLLLPLVDEMSSGERVIIDHSTQEIIHPDCFETAEKTNWIDEVSYGRAKNEYKYEVLDACSKEFLDNKKTSVVKRLLK